MHEEGRRRTNKTCRQSDKQTKKKSTFRNAYIVLALEAGLFVVKLFPEYAFAAHAVATSNVSA